MAGWVDLVAQTPHGFTRVQVKTTDTGDKSIRVRGLGSSLNVTPADRYDTLAVVNKHRLWLIPATALADREQITLHPYDNDCPFNGFRRI